MALVLYYCLKDPDTPLWARRIIMGALGYLILPVDAVPDFLPLVGLTDDLAVLAAAVAIVLVHINPEHKRAAKEKMEELGVGSDVCGKVILPHADEP
ncbi:MAG: YkvA family protein [Gemmatimonadetes bacterium]|nr:YkvA family protein [Gemmatimonadota bacterium]MCY3943953.1 YkvA family protein [Gemmatimonadota bacterium]